MQCGGSGATGNCTVRQPHTTALGAPATHATTPQWSRRLPRSLLHCTHGHIVILVAVVRHACTEFPTPFCFSCHTVALGQIWCYPQMCDGLEVQGREGGRAWARVRTALRALRWRYVASRKLNRVGIANLQPKPAQHDPKIRRCTRTSCFVRGQPTCTPHNAVQAHSPIARVVFNELQRKQSPYGSS